MKSFVCLSCILILAFLISCKKTVLVSETSQCDTVVFKYADHISIVKYSDYSIVELKDPWKKDRILHRYVLVNREDSANIRNIPEGTLVYIPVISGVVSNSPHCQLLYWLGVGDAIKGVCDKSFIRLEEVREGLKNGDIADCGSSMIPAIERVIELNNACPF